jgi:hypothetical protein
LQVFANNDIIEIGLAEVITTLVWLYVSIKYDRL